MEEKIKALMVFEMIGRPVEHLKAAMAEYLKKVGLQTVIKRVCFLLEREKGMDMSGAFKLDKNYAILDQFSNKWNEINSKWRLKV